MAFQVVNHEGSVIISCATSLDLELVQPHSELYTRVPDGRRLIFSSADDPNMMQKGEVQATMYSGMEGQETHFKSSNRPANKYKKRNQVYMGEDHKCQVPISANKNYQAENIKGPVKPRKDM